MNNEIPPSARLEKLRKNGLLIEKAFFCGSWQSASTGKCLEIFNPANGLKIASVPSLGKEETEQAILYAHNALQDWQKVPAAKKANLLRKWANLMMENAEDLAFLLTCEQGKPLHEAKAEILYGAGYIEWFAEEAKRIYGETIPSLNSDQRIVILKQPIGVCAAITPWNFPNAMAARKVAPALAAGCSTLLRPSSYTPLSALAMAVLAEKAGIPPGVFSVLTGSTEDVAATLLDHPLVRKITFTGSTETGKELLRRSAATVKKVTLELGGNAPFLVFEDADLHKAVEGILASKFRNCGQTCVCANRIFAQRPIAAQLSQMLANAASKLRVGNGLEEGVQLGPLIGPWAVEKVLDLLQDATNKGAKILCGGKKHPLGANFFEPTVLLNCSNNMRIAREEIFGPVAPIIVFDTEEEVISLANDTPYGLAAYFYTRDLGRAWRVAEALQTGMAGINTGIISNPTVPFGGVKESGFGLEGGRQGLDEFLITKYLCFAGIDPKN
ncbi:MAG: NAD-dependent succinate-semialdehyde dehydrogenase [Chthoniobacterales bacterium]|nr:NAD-dependent succinate-semialdehyde dehydrogenase [Chthoniobacterales bacterium]